MKRCNHQPVPVKVLGGGCHYGENNDQRRPVSVVEKSFDEVLASKLNNISIKDRSDGLHHLHGVADRSSSNEQETPAMLQSNIQKLNEILDVIITLSPSALFDDNVQTSPDDGSSSATTPLSCHHDSSSASTTTQHLLEQKRNNADAYQLACLLSQEYVDRIKILCLKATDYNCRESALLLLRFFHRKMELFGPDCLARDITLQDLNCEGEEKFALQNGLMQVLPYRDTAGRAIFFADGKVNVHISSTEVVMRTMFYMAMVALKDEETKKNGVTVVFYGVGQKRFVPGRSKEFSINMISLPWKIAAFHFCTSKDEAAIRSPIFMAFLNAFPESTVCRTRLHTGTDRECIYNLLTYGILKQSLPVIPDGSRDLSSHHTMLDTLKAIEEMFHHRHNKGQQQQQQQINNIILIPSPKDVLLGKGRLPKSHPGNLMLCSLIEDHAEIYDNLTLSKDKTRINRKILDTMKNDGCKFLSPLSQSQELCLGMCCDGAFVECTDIVAREKVAHGFRNLRRNRKSKTKMEKQQEQQKNNKRKTS